MRVSRIVPIVVVFLLASALQAKIVYVNKNASGPTSDGTSWGTAMTTVQAGINVAVTGDEVWVATSTPAAPAYLENIIVGNGIALYGGFAGTETALSQRDWKTNLTVLDGNKAGSVVVTPQNAENAIVDGFTIRNGKADQGAGVRVAADGVRITHNIIEHCEGNGMFVYGGGIYSSGKSLSVTNNAIHDNSLFGLDSAYGGGICFYGGYGRVADNLFYRNSLDAYENVDGSAVCAMMGATVAVVNNTITKCSGYAFRPVYFCFGFAVAVDRDSTMSVVNNVVAFNSSGIGVPDNAVRNNLVYQNERCDYLLTEANGNIKADPLFVNYTAGDYRLTGNSPCRNTGDDNVVTSGGTDLDGLPRIQGAHVDMGCYEYSVTAAPFTMSDVQRALSIWAGLATCTADDFTRLDVDTTGGITIADAASIARKVGLLPVGR